MWTSAYRTDQPALGLSQEAGQVLVRNGHWQNGPIQTTALDAQTWQWRWSVPTGVTGPTRSPVAADAERIEPYWVEGGANRDPLGITGRVVVGSPSSIKYLKGEVR